MVISGKTILIISQQRWDTMFISKHHYALELARNGNMVYFLNPPDYGKPESFKVKMEPSHVHPDLFIVTNHLSFPYNIKFHFISLFHALIRSHIKSIVRIINRPIDIVWSFDISYVYPFRFFPSNSIKIFHPVDDPRNQTGIDAAKDAQYIFSTADEILQRYSSYNVPKSFINHGIAEEFIKAEKTKKADDKIRIGFAGNLLRDDIDRPILLQIIDENSEYLFELWGTYEIKNKEKSHSSNTSSFIERLSMFENVILHGPVPTATLAYELNRMDAFLICYDLSFENRTGPNYHKLLEFISTGKVIISNYISVYKNKPQLVQMVQERTHNSALPSLFKKVMNNLAIHNSDDLQQERIQFAKDNTYLKQLERISKKLQVSAQAKI